MGYAKALLGVLLVSALAGTSMVQANFTCKSTGSTCTALVDFVAPNATNLAAIQTLFQVKKFSNLIGANNLPTSTSNNLNVSAGQNIRIPFTCRCANGTGVSNGTPVYTVRNGDTMDHIARDLFAGLVTYEQIAAANGVPDASKIGIGQLFWIPLPCSCDDVDGLKVVHYGYVVPKGSTVEEIAQTYGTTQATLLSLNQMANASELQAGQVLDVPLRACSSNVNSSSLDYPLLVANNTYLYTASNCVKCKCDSTHNYTLQCEPSGLKPLSNWTTCPATQCQGAGSLHIGNTTSSGCNQTTCAYTGYTNQTILAALVSQSTCPASAASKIGFQGWGWNFFLISIQLIFFCLHLSQ